MNLTYEQKQALIQGAKKITLNGEPAVISGAKNRFATVRSTKSGASVDFSWDTASRILTHREGAFRIGGEKHG